MLCLALRKSKLRLVYCIMSGIAQIQRHDQAARQVLHSAEPSKWPDQTVFATFKSDICEHGRSQSYPGRLKQNHILRQLVERIFFLVAGIWVVILQGVT